MEDGVKYVHIGLAAGYRGSILSYFAALPLAARRYQADLVVEDFAAPFSCALSPLWARRPVVAMVQWLHARQKSREYKLPFFLVESLGVRKYRHFITVSDHLADELRTANPDAIVNVIPNAVDPQAFEVRMPRRDEVVFLGRLEQPGKGLDLLFEAFAKVAGHTSVRLVVAGDGPHAAALADEARRKGLGSRVEFVGWVEGRAKHELLSRARLVIVPSRYEAFPIVPLEALACGTPVLAFDIPSLRATVPQACGQLVPAFDVDRLGRALLDLLDEPARLEAMGRQGRRFARSFNWDSLARQQEASYLAALDAPAPTFPGNFASDRSQRPPVSTPLHPVPPGAAGEDGRRGARIYPLAPRRSRRLPHVASERNG